MDVKLIALDLDGTLFNSQSQITPKTAAAIKKATDRGIEIVYSSGRPCVGLPLDFAKNHGIRYAITANGAALYDLSNNTCIYENCMDRDKLSADLKILCSMNLHLDAFIEGEAFSQNSMCAVIDALPMPPQMKEYVKTTRTRVDDLADFVLHYTSQVQKCTLNFPPEEGISPTTRERVIQMIENDPYYRLVSGGFNNLEITKAEVSKADGLRRLCRYLGFTEQNAIACGDSGNDLDILKAAGLGVAMANSTPEILAAADFVTLSNDEDGIAHVIEKFC